ncbi:MAG: FlgD immunoglobulin-like domain containing protein [Candidatus Cloacimonadota bacterium]|nr:FlgD immunoglobulin-like domain containing protein [Candidatus Cloacimonadota bacterium]
MKKDLILLFFTSILTFLCAQDISVWQNIRNSAYTQDSTLYLRCETIDYPGVETGVYFWETDSWNYYPMETQYGFTQQGQINVGDPSQPARFRFKSVHDTLVALMPKSVLEDISPLPLEEHSLLATDPVDEIPTNLDITQQYFAYSEDKFYVVLKNNGGGFPTDSGGYIPNEFYLYTAGIINPEAPDSVAYALSYQQILTYTPGLYKIDPTEQSIESIQRIGNIEYQIDGNLLFMSCNIQDLVNDEDFGEWPNSYNSLLFSVLTNTASLQGTYVINDMGKPSILNFEAYVVEPTENTVPQIYDIASYIENDTTFVSLMYSDAQQNFPLIARSYLPESPQNYYQFLPILPDYSQPVEFITAIPETDWQQLYINFSDNNQDMLEEIYDLTSTQQEDVPATMAMNNYPNPFNPQTSITFNLPNKTTEAELKIYNTRGQLVKNYKIESGQNILTWQGKDNSGNKVASGTYFYALQFDGNILIRKMMLLK